MFYRIQDVILSLLPWLSLTTRRRFQGRIRGVTERAMSHITWYEVRIYAMKDAFPQYVFIAFRWLEWKQDVDIRLK